MSAKLGAGVFMLGLALSANHVALADEPPKPPAPVTIADAPKPAPAPQAAAAGALVVATSEGARLAARALAYDVYRDSDLRPSIDDATARVLAGEALPEGASARLKEIAELRVSIARSQTGPVSIGNPAGVPQTPPAADPAVPAPAAPSDLIARRLLASLGAELGAVLVVTVAMDGTRPVAKVLRTSTSAFERVEFGPTVDIAADGARTYRWPGATSTLHSILIPPAPPPPPPPLVPKAETSDTPAPVPDRPFYKSPWFWGSVGGAVAVGLSVFLISRATSSASNVHVTGKIE